LIGRLAVPSPLAHTACWKQVGPFAEQVKAAPLCLSQQQLDR